MNHHAASMGRCLLALFLFGASQLAGADKPQAGNAAAKATEPNASAAWQRRIPELVSDNLPLAEIVAELRRQFREINFLLKNQADLDFDIGSLSVNMVLRSVTLEEILKALELATQSPIQITGAPDDRLVVFEKKQADPGLPPAGVESRVFNISRYLDNRSDEAALRELESKSKGVARDKLRDVAAKVALMELEEVLHTAGNMLSKATRGERRFNPQLNFHRSTKLLIVVARPDELRVIEQVVKELQGPLPEARVTTPDSERDLKPAPPGERPAGSKL